VEKESNGTKIAEVAENLFLITLRPPILGFDDFISAWLYRGDVDFIVDTGPSVTAPGLIDALSKAGVSKLAYILLTHIHIDHAGGVGEVAERFPEAKIVCHKAGIPHLVDSAKLWEGTLKTLGETGRAYGPVKNVEESRFVDAETFDSPHAEAILTPGHSVHHVSYMAGPVLFAGEAGGVCLNVEPGLEYLRPATPPKFFLETSVKSIDALISKRPKTICYGHCGMRDDAAGMLARHRAQLFFWKDAIGRELSSSPRKNYVLDCQNVLLREDGNLEGFFRLEPDKQERERGFLANSIRGFAGYLQSLADNP
jgi:glyoxylase-like metal-dependent hydrolase (beta-lactamase superfamily II)